MSFRGTVFTPFVPLNYHPRHPHRMLQAGAEGGSREMGRELEKTCAGDGPGGSIHPQPPQQEPQAPAWGKSLTNTSSSGSITILISC